MANEDRVILKVNFSKWFLVFFGIAGLVAVVVFVPLFISSLIHFAQIGFTIPRLIISAVLLATPLGYLSIVKCIYLWIIATESGLEAVGILQPRRVFTWDEIITVNKPHLGIARDAVYVLSKTGKKMVLSKSMKGYPKLLALIQSRAPNLSPKELPQELLPSESLGEWKYLLTFFGLFIAYIIVKLIFEF
jgi:hypothetical protein